MYFFYCIFTKNISKCTFCSLYIFWLDLTRVKKLDFWPEFDSILTWHWSSWYRAFDSGWLGPTKLWLEPKYFDSSHASTRLDSTRGQLDSTLIYIYTHIYIYTYIYINIYINIYLCIYICIYKYIYMYKYVHRHIINIHI